MADDPYKTLGVARDATEKQIRKAYLKLAKTMHPDLNPGDAAAEERFKAVNAAHDLLQDAEQRGRYDRGEIDGAGQQRPPPGPPPGSRRYRDHAEGAAGTRYSAGTGMDDDLGAPERLLASHLDQGVQVRDVAVHSAVGGQTHQVQAFAGAAYFAHHFEEYRVAEKRSVGDR